MPSHPSKLGRLTVAVVASLTLTATSFAKAQEPTPAKPAKAANAAKPAKTTKPTKTTTTAKAASKPAAGEKPAAEAALPEKPTGPPPASSSPMAELKKSNEKLDKILQKNRPNWSPEAELQRAEVQKLVGSFLDYGELARRALAKNWDGLTPKQRDQFVNTLRELVERSYLKQVHGNPNYNIKYEKETKDGNEASVTGTLNTVARGKKVKIALDYKLLWKDRWVVYDVVTDEQSMLENYRAEFNKIIKKEGFDALLARMKRKLEEKEE